jgi:large repetitive protein
VRLILALFVNLVLLTLGLPPSANAQSASAALSRWTRTADLTAARSAACAVVLNDGRLLVAGGLGDSGSVAAVDIYGSDGAFIAGPPMTHARSHAACVMLDDGRVLVTGGNDGNGSLNSAEIFDPSTNQWQPTGSLAVAREGHQMAMTSWGFAWVAGGDSDGAITGTLELFNPNTGQFQAIGTLNTARAEFAMTPTGRSLVIAGGTDGSNTLSSIEIYDGSLGTLTVAGSMLGARKDFAAAALLDGTIMLTGGVDANGVALTSTEVFDPVKGTSTPGPSLLSPRAFHSAYAMPHNGSVLIYGGMGNSGVLSSTEVYTPWTGNIAQGAALNSARREEAKAGLRAGSYMIAGGRNDLGFLSGSEVFRFSTITTDKGDYAPGTPVKISGGGWIPGEQVLVTLTAFPVDQHHMEFTGAAVADGAGNISIPGFAVDKSHLGMKFLISAVGSQSKAQATFTDGIDPTISYSFNPPATTPGTPVTVTVTLTPPDGEHPAPTGSIIPCTAAACPTTLTVSGCTGTVCTLSPGAGNTAVASFTISFPAGTTTFGVTYSGDSNYNFEVPTPGATPPGAPVAIYTSQSFTVADLAGGPVSPAPFGTQTPYVANVCITATSGGACTGSGTLSGKVQFFVNGAASGSPVSIVPRGGNTGSGSASFIPNPPLAVGGPYVITATYGNDLSSSGSNSTAANGGAASISTTIIPAIAATSTVLTAMSDDSPNPNSPLPTEIGRRITLTAVTTTTTTGSTQQPKASAIAITPPAGNTLAGSSNTCGSNLPVASSTSTSVTVTCSFVLMGPFPSNTPPTVTANASYAGDTTIGTAPSAAAPLAIPVMQAITITSLTASASPDPLTAVQIGRVVTLTAKIVTLNNGSGVDIAPAGSVTFTLPAGTFLNPSCGTQNGDSFTISPSAGNVSATLFNPAGGNQGVETVTCTFTVVPLSPAAAVGAEPISAVYNGDSLTLPLSTSRGLAAQANAMQLTAVVDGTRMAACVSTPGGLCSGSGNVYTYGQTISFAGTLSSNTTLPADGAAYQPSASVTFNGTGLSFVTPIVPTTTGGTASWTVPFLPPAIGAYTVNVNYPTAQTDPYYGASGTQVSFTVNKAATRTAVQPLSVTAGIPNLQVIVYNSSILGSGTPTGTVQVTNGLSSAAGTLAPSGNCNGLAASCSVVTVLVPSGSNYVATYPGDSNFVGSSSQASGSVPSGGSATSLTPADSSLAISVSPNPAQVNQPITITINVQGINGGSSSPTGTVTLSDNGAVIGVNPVVASIATFTVTLGPGSHTITPVYSGDSIFPKSTASYGMTVVKPAQTTTFSASISISAFGQPVTLSATLKGASGSPAPTGSVQFLANGVALGSPVTLVNGAASLTTSSLPPGANLIAVQYSGDSYFAGSTVNGGTVTVSQAQVTTTLAVTTNGAQMTLSATLAVVSPGSGTPTGTVKFIDTVTGAVLGAATVSANSASVTIAVTSDPIVAVYSGDANFLSSTSSSTAATTITALNAASDVAAFSADTIISIYGSGLTTQTLSGALPLPSTLGGVSVTVTDSMGVARQASLFFVSPGQINLLIPAGTATGTATITVNTANGSLTTTINISASTAALFTANNNGSGPLAAQIVAVAPGGQETYTNTAALNGTKFVNAAISFSPAADTFYLLLYGTGFDNAKAVTVTINGQTFTPAYFGPQGGFAGLDQVNVFLPAGMAGSGQVNVSITVDGQTSNVGTISFATSGTN